MSHTGAAHEAHKSSGGKLQTPPPNSKPGFIPGGKEEPFWKTQGNAYMLLLEASVDAIQDELKMTSETSKFVEDLATGAAASVDASNTALTKAEEKVHNAGGGDNLKTAPSDLSVLQTQISQQNQELSNITQQGSGELSSLSQAQSQQVLAARVVNENSDSTNQNIAAWGG